MMKFEFDGIRENTEIYLIFLSKKVYKFVKELTCCLGGTFHLVFIGLFLAGKRHIIVNQVEAADERRRKILFMFEYISRTLSK